LVFAFFSAITLFFEKCQETKNILNKIFYKTVPYQCFHIYQIHEVTALFEDRANAENIRVSYCLQVNII